MIRPLKNTISIVTILVADVLVASIISCMLVFYGPFTVVRKYIVGNAMSSYTHQWLAKIFLSDDQIKAILNQSTDTITPPAGSDTNDSTDLNGITVHYTDNSIKEIQITSPDNQFSGYLLIINNPLRVKVGYTSALGVHGERTSDIAIDHNATAAINGGGFTDKTVAGGTWTGTGSLPSGILMTGGKIIHQDISDDTKIYVAAFTNEGKLVIGRHSVNELQQLNVSEALSFNLNYPLLIVNGQKTDAEGEQTARTAIGQRKDGSVLLLVLDGRHMTLPGATLHDVQKIMYENGAYNAMNLDGGSSTTMYLNGKVINDPCDPLGERSVASAFYVTK